MKKIIALILSVLALTALFAGCGESADGETCEISLKANATTGYQWDCKASPEGIVKVEGEYVPDENKQGFVGVGGTQKYTVTAKKAGEVTLTFDYLSPGDKVSGSTAVYVLSVDEDLNITELSHSGSYFDDK